MTRFCSLIRRAHLVVLVAGFAVFSAAVHADLKIKVPTPPVPPLPKIVLPAPPPMVWLPGPKVYVAHDSPHEIFYYGNRYYVYERDAWYVGSAYNGPWRVIRAHQVPPGLRGYRHDHWRRYQREADDHFRDRHYRHQRHPFYAGHPHERAYWRDDRRRESYRQDERRGRDHDRGRHEGQERRKGHDKGDRRGRGRD